MSNRIYTLNPKILLAADEGPIYDAMLEHSTLLKGAATITVKELLDLMKVVHDAPDDKKEETAQEVYRGLHRAMTYCFAVGASFAFAQIALSTTGGHALRKLDG